VGLFSLIQASIFGVVAAYLWNRWLPLAWLMVLCAALQLGGFLALIRLGRPRITRWAGGLSLVCVATGLGLYSHAALHLMERFGEDAARTGEDALVSMVGALPWLIIVPLWQVMSLGAKQHSDRRRSDSRWFGLLILAGLVLPPAGGAWSDQPEAVWPAQPSLEKAARAAWMRWTGEDLGSPIPSGNGPVQLLMTPWVEGIPGRTVRGEGESLSDAVIDALERLETWPGGRTALVVDLAREQLAGGALPVGESGALADNGGLSPSVAWRPGSVTRQLVFYRWSIPSIDSKRLGQASPARFDSVVVDELGPRPLQAGWSAPEALTARSARASAIEGALMLARNQDSSGRFSYLIRGPSGERGQGYNLPRHAGTTWFLARAALHSGDPVIEKAARRALDWMVERSSDFGKDMSSFSDSRRKDGKIWVGTTALAVLAAVVLEHDIALSWGRFLAASVDDAGQVRGEAVRETELFPEQSHNPYGQGQTLLALASLVRAGHSEFVPALQRGAAYLDAGYGPLGAGKLVTIDEHWACLAALAIGEVSSEVSGAQICEAYLRDHSLRPSPSRGLRAPVSAAGGVAEAVVAMAVLDPEGPWRERALGYGELFLEAQYRSGDAPFLENPETLMGGFRTSPARLDVQIDTVQHVGSALLGIASLIDGDWTPGSLP
jgi:hypothetical protein